MAGLNPVGGYEIDVLVQGYPGRSLYHGWLGWSTIVVLRGHGRVVLIDTGGFNQRKLLADRLSERGVTPGQVTDLLLSHSHFDHTMNWTRFRDARIAIGRVELEWCLQQPWGETEVPELYMRELQAWPGLRLLEDGEEVLPGITARLAPGHTPGHLIFILRGEDHDVIFLQDAVKNRAELVSRQIDMTYDAAVATATVEMVWGLWRSRPGSVVVPGHDLPMRLEDGLPRYLGERRAALAAWFSDNLQCTTEFELTADRLKSHS